MVISPCHCAGKIHNYCYYLMINKMVPPTGKRLSLCLSAAACTDKLTTIRTVNQQVYPSDSLVQAKHSAIVHLCNSMSICFDTYMYYTSCTIIYSYVYYNNYIQSYKVYIKLYILYIKCVYMVEIMQL